MEKKKFGYVFKNEVELARIMTVTFYGLKISLKSI